MSDLPVQNKTIISQKPNITIRPISREDDGAMAQIVRENLRNHHLDIPGTAYFDPQLDYLSRYYAEEPGQRRYFVAQLADGTIAGGIGVALFPGFDRCGEIQKLYVRPDMQHLGIGQQLLAYLEAFAPRLGLERMYLETHSNLRQALRFYEKNGYRKIPRPESVVHSTMDLFYRKELTR